MTEERRDPWQWIHDNGFSWDDVNAIASICAAGDYDITDTRAAISSSSATETQDEQPDWETPEQTERRIARDSAWTPLRQANPETQDGKRHDPSDHDCRGGVRGDRYPLETQDGERPAVPDATAFAAMLHDARIGCNSVGNCTAYHLPDGHSLRAAFIGAATPTPDDRDREVERIAAVLVPFGGFAGTEAADVWLEGSASELAAALYDAGLRALGGDREA